MAIVAFNAAIRGLSGRLGDMVFYERNGTACARRHVVPHDPKSQGQMACRKAFAALVAEWRAMGEDARKEWNERARGKNLSGFNAFISANMERMREAISAPAAPVMVTVVTSSRSKDMGHADTSVRTLVIVGRGMLSRTSSRAPCGAVARRERS